MMRISKPYYYVRFKWWTDLDLKKIFLDFSKDFAIRRKKWPIVNGELTLYPSKRDEVTITADTLSALLSPSNAILYQRTVAPLTPKDLILRQRVLDLYPHTRPTPLPWLFTHEPKFELAETSGAGDS
jgi:hypothetical protein